MYQISNIHGLVSKSDKGLLRLLILPLHHKSVNFQINCYVANMRIREQMCSGHYSRRSPTLRWGKCVCEMFAYHMYGEFESVGTMGFNARLVFLIRHAKAASLLYLD